jgi:hypothetical protein
MIYRKGDDQSSLFARAKEQERTHEKSEADSNGYIVGLNEKMSVGEFSKDLGGGPISAKGMRMGQQALHSQRTHPNVWKNAGFTLADERKND